MGGPLRDDHEAALARADALQVELDVQRKQDEALQAELGQAKAQLAAARARLAELAPSFDPGTEPVAPPPRRAPPAHRPSAAVAVLGMLMIGGVLAGVHSSDRDEVVAFRSPYFQPHLAALDTQLPWPQPQAEVVAMEGLGRAAATQPLAAIIARDVRSDGSLDLAGRVEIWIARPDATSHSYGTSWSSNDGTSWRGAAITTPIVGSMQWPTCSIEDILGRGGAVKDATVTARWTGETWRWTYQPSDGMSSTFDDDCGQR